MPTAKPPLLPAIEGSEPPAAAPAVLLKPVPRPDPYYADALKNVLDVFPASGTPVAAPVVVHSFSSPFLRQQVKPSTHLELSTSTLHEPVGHRWQFGSVKLQDTGWPASAHKGELPSLPRAAGSRSHTSLSHTMLSTPLVPRPLSQHSASLVPRQRPLSRAERAQGREWQGRHQSLATRGISAYETCAHEVDSVNADVEFRRSLEAIRYNRFHFAGQGGTQGDTRGGKRRGTREAALVSSPPQTPRAPPALEPPWEAVLRSAALDWGDMRQADELLHGRRHTEADRVREVRRGSMRPVRRPVRLLDASSLQS
jgi:hypothetical protein